MSVIFNVYVLCVNNKSLLVDTSPNYFYIISIAGYSRRSCKQSGYWIKDHSQHHTCNQSSALLPTAILRCMWTCRKGIVPGETKNTICINLGIGWRTENVRSCLPSSYGCSYHSLCSCHPSLHHFDGFHWKLHWMLSLLHLALYFPSEITSPWHGLARYDVWHVHHLLWSIRRHAWDVLFWQGATTRFWIRCASLNKYYSLRTNY